MSMDSKTSRMTAGAIVCMFLLTASLAWAAPARSSVTDLGRPTNALPSANNPARWSDALWETIHNEGGSPRQFPLLAVGNYLSTGDNVAIWGNLGTQSNAVVPFSTIQESLKLGKAISVNAVGPPASLTTDYNAEANVITAFICHADGLKPAKVCGRAVTKKILRHIK
jgi:hypothetical protein